MQNQNKALEKISETLEKQLENPYKRLREFIKKEVITPRAIDIDIKPMAKVIRCSKCQHKENNHLSKNGKCMIPHCDCKEFENVA